MLCNAMKGEHLDSHTDEHIRPVTATGLSLIVGFLTSNVKPQRSFLKSSNRACLRGESRLHRVSLSLSRAPPAIAVHVCCTARSLWRDNSFVFCVFPYCKSYSREVHRMCGPQVCGGWENNLSRGASFSTRPRPPPLSVPQIFYLLRFGGSGRPHLSNFVCRRRGDRPVSLPLFSPPACSQARILKVERWQPWWQELVGNQTRDDVNSGFYNSFPEGE